MPFATGTYSWHGERAHAGRASLSALPAIETATKDCYGRCSRNSRRRPRTEEAALPVTNPLELTGRSDRAFVDAAETPSALASFVLALLEEEKAADILRIDLRGKSPLADDMIIASGRSARHVRAIAEHLAAALKKEYGRPSTLEGIDTCDWVLVDAGDAIVHVFQPEIRAFYDLEKLWLTELATRATVRG